MRSALGVLVATGMLAVVPGDIHVYDPPIAATDAGLAGHTPVRAATPGGLHRAEPEARARAACEAGLAGRPAGITAIPALISLLADDAHVDAIDCGGEWRNIGIFGVGDASLLLWHLAGARSGARARAARPRRGGAAPYRASGSATHRCAITPPAPWRGATIPRLPPAPRARSWRC